MPFYTFNCDTCDDTFTEWHQSLKGNKETTTCPGCEKKATRVFTAPNTFVYSKATKQRVERGKEPRYMTKEELHQSGAQKLGHRHGGGPGRPWQMGHSH